jgi:hypothetical protein
MINQQRTILLLLLMMMLIMLMLIMLTLMFSVVMVPASQAFLSEVVRDDEYMAKTWEVTPVWNASLRRELAARFPNWKVRCGTVRYGTVGARARARAREMIGSGRLVHRGALLVSVCAVC